jgi:hypothetical protein
MQNLSCKKFIEINRIANMITDGFRVVEGPIWFGKGSAETFNIFVADLFLPSISHRNYGIANYLSHPTIPMRERCSDSG